MNWFTKRSPLVRKTRLSPKGSKLRREVPDWKRVSERVRSEPSGALRDEAFLDFVRGHSCTVPGCRARRSEAHHFGKRPKGTKCSDYETVPLCTKHHREFHDRGAIGDVGRGELRLRWGAWAEDAKRRFLLAEPASGTSPGASDRQKS